MDEKETGQADPKEALQQVLVLLKARDDTSRFVGLSLLRSLLDAHKNLRDFATVQSCWEAISNKFLIRLMRSGQSKSIPPEEAKNMQELAVAIVNTFTNLLPDDDLEMKKMTELCEPLVHLIPRLDAAPQMLAFQTLQCLANGIEGGHSFESTCSGNLEDFRNTAVGDERYLKEYLKLYSIAWPGYGGTDMRKEITTTLLQAEKADPSLVLEALAALAQELTFLNDTEFIGYVGRLIKTTLQRRPTAKARTAAIKLASAILQSVSPNSIFSTYIFEDFNIHTQPEEKPFAYVFIQYVLIDLRSTIPSLMANLASPVYTTDSLRLAACYDVVGAFILYLMKSMDRDEDEDGPKRSVLPPDLLLKLRRDLGETFSLTIEFLRDRWDATTSGASGLDPTARTDPKAPSMLTWDNPGISPEEDPILISGLRALSLWIREDDNSQLHTQAIDIIDVLAALYSSSMEPGASTDFRHPILILLEGLLPDSSNAVQLLLDQDGWVILARDLHSCLQPLFKDPMQAPLSPLTQDLIRVLLSIVESNAVPQSRETWMDVVTWAADIMRPEVRKAEEDVLEVIAGAFQLVLGVVSKAPIRLQAAVKGKLGVIQQEARKLLQRHDIHSDGTIESLREIEAALEEFV